MLPLQLQARNGKYASLAFATRRRREALRAEGKLLPDELTDDLGNSLGGKRAAIQVRKINVFNLVVCEKKLLLFYSTPTNCRAS